MSEFTYRRTSWDDLHDILNMLERTKAEPTLHLSFAYEGRKLVTIQPDGSGAIQPETADGWGDPIETFRSLDELDGLLHAILGGAIRPRGRP